MAASVRNKVFVGYDSREDIAWQVCRHSLLRHADNDLIVAPLKQPVLRELGLYTRPDDLPASTEFSLTRFLTPYLAAQSGWVVFCDCDFLFTGDVRKVFEGLDPTKAVYCVQHEYTPAYDLKMDGKKQAAYPRKNWSSFTLFNCDHPDVKALTPAVVNSATPAFLHQFQWISDDRAIGALDRKWNFLAGEYPRPDAVPEVIHFTNGGPWFEEWQDCDYAELWREELNLYRSSRTGPRIRQVA
jgi:lipopolysaccharide biosynthesis glycosyltransferase